MQPRLPKRSSTQSTAPKRPETDPGGDVDLYGDDQTVRSLLRDAQVWFVVGLRDNPARAAYGVAALLQSKGKRIVPIHPQPATVHGEPGYPSIAAAAAAVGPPDVVDVFVRSELVGPIVAEAIAADAGAIWLQLGVVDEEAARAAQVAGLATVMNRCPAQDWPRLGPAA